VVDGVSGFPPLFLLRWSLDYFCFMIWLPPRCLGGGACFVDHLVLVIACSPYSFFFVFTVVVVNLVVIPLLIIGFGDGAYSCTAAGIPTPPLREPGTMAAEGRTCPPLPSLRVDE
jgi:hypothetical protein